ncbi:branched-chain amino acid ABC transporter substrate-binding protein [Thermoflexus sp.]|jgi:branched-chain amino acid transport system substrate-binding protein|uniref:branched-chain amino acid ABC transporter substrate-binding protein n=1 Tax=Thermoflexus sp. TaxID=1969742 RepID=UPI002630F20D|nr:branched-chain amino acid ABC transporter substrate-binding protein [Thermoflexus sp.]
MKFSRILMALTVFSLLLAACVPAATPTPTQAPAAPAASPTPAVKGTIKIATQSPLSGDQAALGEGIKNGAQLAIEQLKGPIEALGFKVELVPFDDQAKPDVGVANAKQLVNDPDILAVIGHLNSGVAIPSSEIYKDYDLVMVSPANTNPCVTDRGYLVVNRVCGRDDVQGQVVAADFAFNELKVKTAFVIHDKTTYGQGVAEFFKKRFEELGGQVLGFEGTEEKANFDPLITAIQAANPELIFFGGIYSQAGVFFKQAREKGVKAIFLGPDGMDSSELVRIAGDAVVGMYYTTVAAPPTALEGAKKFVEDYKAKFGKDPEPFSAQAYDATAIVLKAIEAAIQEAGGQKPSRKAVAEKVRATKDFQGITGVITFDERGDPVKAKYFVMKVVSGKPEDWGKNVVAKTLELAPPPFTPELKAACGVK